MVIGEVAAILGKVIEGRGVGGVDGIWPQAVPDKDDGAMFTVTGQCGGRADVLVDAAAGCASGDA